MMNSVPMHDEFVRANAAEKFSVGLNEPAKQSLEIVFLHGSDQEQHKWQIGF